MTNGATSCPNCRARVFASWSECKFCGTTLRDEAIGAAVDPDELVSAPAEGTFADDGGWDSSPDGAPPWEPSALQTSEPARPGGFDGPDRTPSGVGSDAGGWDTPVVGGDDPADPWAAWPSESSGFSESAGSGIADADGEPVGSLVPLEPAEPTWAPGPAPGLADDGPGDATNDEDSWGTTGLDPVDWYPEPTGPPDLDPSAGTDPSGAVTSDDEAGFEGWSPMPIGDAPPPPVPEPPEGADEAPGFDGELFDPGAIFRDPEPGDRPGVGRDLEQVPEPGDRPGVGRDLEQVPEPGDLAVQWEPAAADAWDTPVEPEGRPRGQAVLSREARILLMGLILVIVVAGAALWLKDDEAGHPSEWAPNVQGVADWVAETRGLAFDHKVAVVALTPDEFDASVEHAARPEDDSVRRELTDTVAMWRALGAVEGNDDARLSWVGAQRPELGAFYDLDSGKLNLRSGADVDRLGVGLAGALSVALDDQHGDLSAFRETGIDENPVFDVVAGTAALMRGEYSDSRSATDGRATDDPERLPDLDDAGADVGFLEVQPVMQTGLGQGFVQFVRASEGVEAGNALATSPPVSSQQVMFPLAYLSGRGPLGIDAPQTPEGTELLDSGTVGAATWYLLLAGRTADHGDLGDVFDFAQRWAGDQYVAYREADGRVCVTDVLRGADESDLRSLTASLGSWAAAVPGDRITVEAAGDLGVAVTGCDPGPDAEQSLAGSYGDSALTAIVRARLAAGYYAAGTEVDNGPNPPIFTPETAWCMARTAAERSPSLELWQLMRENGATYEQVTLAAGQACGSHLVDQLFAQDD